MHASGRLVVERRQPADGGLLKTTACAGILMVSLEACWELICNDIGGALCMMQEQDVASHSGWYDVGWRRPLWAGVAATGYAC